MEDDTIGQVAYNAYCEFVGWKSVGGHDLPKFQDQSDRLKEAWEHAAEAVYSLAI